MHTVIYFMLLCRLGHLRLFSHIMHKFSLSLTETASGSVLTSAKKASRKQPYSTSGGCFSHAFFAEVCVLQLFNYSNFRLILKWRSFCAKSFSVICQDWFSGSLCERNYFTFGWPKFSKNEPGLNLFFFFFFLFITWRKKYSFHKQTGRGPEITFY